MEDKEVVYLQCPHCKQGWYGKFLYKELNRDEYGVPTLESFVIQGLAPTDLTKELTCLNCGGKYTPLTNSLRPTPIEPGWSHEYKKPPFKLVPKDCELHWMSDWVAERLISCKGH